MNQLPAPFVDNCQNITINYNIFQRQWIFPFSDFLKLIISLSYKWKHYFSKVTEESEFCYFDFNWNLLIFLLLNKIKDVDIFLLWEPMVYLVFWTNKNFFK
jgi:hypothetical protein